MVLSNLEQLVVKEAQGSGGYGMLIWGPKRVNSKFMNLERK